ncbi:MAG: hypothetical protein L3K19_08380 [Thermoplasmata archaeon]|nr:hypothetical protein [Thermoplasmata archaeon]
MAVVSPIPGVMASATASTAIAPSPGSQLTDAGPFSAQSVSLGMLSETGPALGGELAPGESPPLSLVVSVDVNLPIQHPAALGEFVQSVSDPFSPDYAQFLSTAQFTERFAPPLADQLMVAGYLESKGLNVVSLAPNHLSLTVRGTLAQLETAFHVTFAMYSEGPLTFWAATSSPAVPANVAPWIYGVTGLTDHPSNVHLQAVGPATSVPGTGLQDYPDQMHYEFQLNQLYNATGDKSAGVVPTYAKGVTIVQALWSASTKSCGYSVSDIGNFFNNSTGYPGGLPKPVMQPHFSIPGYAAGAPASGNCSTSGLNVSNTGTQEVASPTIELTLDQEYSGTDAPGANLAPTWVNGTGPAATNGELVGLINWVTGGNVPGLNVLTQSFGGGESPNTTGSFQSILEQDYVAAAATGVTVLASSGDNNGALGPAGAGGALCGPGPADEGVPGIDYPGSSPNVLSVGGTANAGLGNSILGGQSVWNWCPSTNGGLSGGSTGGVSLAFPEAWYQKPSPIVAAAMRNAITITVTGNGSTSSPLGVNDGTVYSNSSARPAPDLAGPAANNTIYFAQQWLSGYGGTSFSSPAVAGMLGSIIAFDGHPLGPFGPALYGLESKWLGGKLALPPTYFVQNYSNAFFNGATDYNTSAGWGVPLAYNIALDLGKPFLTTAPHRSAPGASYPVSVRVSDHRDVQTVKALYLASGSTNWASISLVRTHGTAMKGTWTGTIPAATVNGSMRYCVEASDAGRGNSWTPYNLSAWAATGGANTTFGCTTPWSVAMRVPAPPPAAPAVGIGSGAWNDRTTALTFTPSTDQVPSGTTPPREGYVSTGVARWVTEPPSALGATFWRSFPGAKRGGVRS